jgi:SAM-dependent methyltransferase
MTRPPIVLLRRAIFWARYKLEVVGKLARRRRGQSAKSAVAVVYVYPIVGDAAFDANARRFVSTYRDCPPLHDHSLHVVCNGAAPSSENRAVFEGLDVEFHQHDNSGWDIGAFQTAAREIDCDVIVCLGATSYFKRGGWLKRMIEAVDSHGDGLYGASASYERGPHIRTTAFWCEPMLIRAYPKRAVAAADRLEFESGDSSITRLAERIGLGCWMVTWEAECSKYGWRTPSNIFRRGNQRNSLVFDQEFDLYAAMDDESRVATAALADSRASWGSSRGEETSRSPQSDCVARGERALPSSIPHRQAVRANGDDSTEDALIVFRESAGAHFWCKGKGIEVGASAHNPFGLDTVNVDITDDGGGQVEQMHMCGEIRKVDIIAPGDDLPFEDESQDFVVSSHVLEHFPDPIAALLEWYRVTRPGGVIYMIVPHKERTFDRDRERTTLEHLVADHKQGAVTDNTWDHQHVWVTQDVVELVEWMADEMAISWHLGEVQDVDDKVGNGFAIALVKGVSSVPARRLRS